MVYAVSRVVPVEYAEIVASVASPSAGPGTRANIDEFTKTTARGVETIGGAQRGKAIIILNPAEPPMLMQDTIFCAIPADADRDAIAASIKEIAADVAAYVPGYRLRTEPQFDDPTPMSGGRRPRRRLRRGRGGGRLPAAVLGQPRHHDRRRHPGRGRVRHADPRRARLKPTGDPFMSYSADLDVRVTDSSLRDGSHAIRHQFTVENVRTIVAALDEAGVPVIEVTHGDGLGGSSFNYGFSAVPDQDLIATAVATAKQAKIAFLMLPGLGTTDDIRQAADNGASVCRIATHCTEADISIQHFKVARSIGLETVGFLMMAHSQPPEVLARQARIMADAGAQCVYVVDSAGSLIMDGVSDRIAALVAELGDDAQVGFHGHENLGLGVANSVLAARAGAKQIDGSTRRFGAGAGNTPVEAFAAVTERLGIKTGIDTVKIIDAAEETVAPVLERNPPALDRLSLTMGYAGVYSSFLKHAEIQARSTACPGPRSSSRPAAASSSAARRTSSSRSRWASPTASNGRADQSERIAVRRLATMPRPGWCRCALRRVTLPGRRAAALPATGW